MEPLQGRLEKDVKVWPRDPVRFRAVLDADQNQLDIQVDLDWSPTYIGRKQNFIRDYRTQIDRYWSDRFTIRIHFEHGGSQKTYTVRPRVVLAETARAASHFVMKIQNTRHAPSYVMIDAGMDSFFKKMKRKITRRGSPPSERNVCVLAPDDVHASQDTVKMKIGIKTSHVNNAGWGYSDTVWGEAKRHFACVESTVPFKSGSSTADVPAALMGIAQQIARAYQTARAADLPLVPLVVVGHTGRSEVAGLGVRRAQHVADAIGSRLTASGLGGIQIETREKHHSSSTVAEIRISKGFSAFKRTHEYPIAAHEFGHMLGLLDEYFPADHPQNRDAAPRYIKYCEQHGLGRPEFDRNSLSIMSMGDRVKPCHYVPFMVAIDRVLEDRKSAIARSSMRKSGDEKRRILAELEFVASAQLTIVEA